MKEFLHRVGIKLTSTKAMAFFLIVAVLAFVELSPSNAEVLMVLVISLFGANAAQHLAVALGKRKE
jgi:hypothetical protein